MKLRLKILKRKKAMSALVSTVILIGFATMLGFMVMSWGTGMAGQVPNECDKVTLSISTEGDSIMVVPKINNLLCNQQRLDISEILR
jgi:hypothetical protein